MNALEQRLRQQLPQLADALTHEAGPPQPAARSRSDASRVRLDSTKPRAGRRPARLVTAGVAAATVLILVGGLLTISRVDDPDDSGPGSPAVRQPTGFGVWRPTPDAPIDPRPYAVSAWTGTEAVFWAGSSLSRGFAYTDGAAFDPRTDSWRTLTVPGWGHPGLTSVFFDGELYALAKGGGTRFDPVEGTWVDLPEVENMFLAAAVATDDAVWGLGPTTINPAGQADVAIAQYEPSTDTWIYGTVFEGTDETSEIVAGLSQLETQTVWTGQEILAWNGAQGGLAFDPASGAWRTVAPPPTPSGSPSDGLLAVTNSGVALLAEIDRADGRSHWDVALRIGDDWSWRGSRIPIEVSDTVSVVAAGDWIVLFSELQRPVTVHGPTGEWKQHDDGPLAGLTAPNTVWTGDQLIVWGGVASPTSDNAEPTIGATWTPTAG